MFSIGCWAGVDLEQLFVSQTAAFKFTDHLAVGVSLNIGWQRFSGEGLQNFTAPGSPSILPTLRITATTRLVELGFPQLALHGSRGGPECIRYVLFTFSLDLLPRERRPT